MEKLVKGNVVVLIFPFSDLSSTKKRPALIVATLEGEDIICCQITSKTRLDQYALVAEDKDFKEGSLNQISQIRPNKLFTADTSIIKSTAGGLTPKIRTKILQRVRKLFTY